jgi:hypothetical protein
VTDPLKIMADLKPVRLDQLTEEAYRQRRAADLSRAMASAQSMHSDAHDSGRIRLMRTRRWTLVSGAGVLGTAAVTTLALTGALAGRPALPVHPRTGWAAPSSPSAPRHATLDARAFLLSSAEVVSHAPAITGTYWYVKERDFEPSWARPALPKGWKPTAPQKGVKKPVLPAAKGQGFGAFYAATEESWTGQSRARTIVNEDLAFNFAFAAGEAAWEAAGKPPLFNPTGGFGYSGTATNDYSMTFYFGYGAHRLPVDSVRKLPGTEGALAATLRQMWNTEPDKQAAVGPANPTFGQYVFTWASALLGGPASPSTKAALYRLLAAQPGIQVAAQVTDPLGRTGIAVSDGTGSYLLINPSTGELLATTTYAVHAGGRIPAAASDSGTEAIIATGWTDTLTPAS